MHRLTLNALLGLALLAAGCGHGAAPATSGLVPATATAMPGAAGPVVLGGTVAAFIATYGRPNNHRSRAILHFNRYPGSNIDALSVVVVTFGTIGPDRAGAVFVAANVSDQAPDQGWSMATARSACAPYLPRDSKAGKKVPVVTGAGAVLGEDDFYTSATLASQFPASEFTDADGNAVAAGTFDVFYYYERRNDPSRVGFCSLGTGSAQAKA